MTKTPDLAGLRRLRAHQLTVAEKLEDLRARASGFEAAIAEPLPPAANHDAARRRVAQALATDALEGSKTVDGIRESCEAECSAAEQALATAKARRLDAGTRLRETRAAIRELEVMAETADAAVRAELARVGVSMLPDRKAAVYAASAALVEAWAAWRGAAGLAAQAMPEESMRRTHGFELILPVCESADGAVGLAAGTAVAEFVGYGGIAITESVGLGLASQAFERMRAELFGEGVSA